MSTKYVITLCDGPSCMQKKSRELMAVVEREVEKYGFSGKVKIILSGCLGMCNKGPVMIVNPGYTIYGNVTERDIPLIIKAHFEKKLPGDKGS